MSPEASKSTTTTAKVVVATTVALSFISFWRGAAIVLADLASSAFYAGGIAATAVGPAAPWFVLGVMLFSFAVRSVYMESCSMFVRGGVYIVVKDSMGPFMARLSVSALVFDYILTGPISVVSAGQYLGHLLDEIAKMLGQSFPFNVNYFAVFFAVAVTAYFWWMNIKGLHESSGKALRIMQITTIMVLAFVIWCPITLLLRGHVQVPPAPLSRNLQFSPEALGWFKGTFWPSIPIVALVIAFGHSLLSMSGFETLAQVYREIAYPKLRNLRFTANIVCWYAVICTGVVTVLASFIISSSDIRNLYADNLLGGLAMRLAGPELLKLAFHIFVVTVGVLILSGAMNTSLIGANGVLNRVAEDGVLLDWFRKPHKRFGTTHRIINLITLLQIVTILLSRGDVYLLGEAYAFGVVWSFFLKSLGVLVLRYQRHDQEYKFPFNIRMGGVEIPIGLGVTTLILGFVAIANLFSKQIATIYGVAFTLVVFVVFTVSEHVNARKRRIQPAGEKALEEFNLEHQPQVSAAVLRARPGCLLVAVRDYHHMEHLRKVLQKTNLRRHDIVVMTVRTISAGAGEYDLADEQIFSDYERELFSHVVEMAEKEGKPVELLEVPAVNPFDAMVQSAAKLKASRLVTGVSERMTSEDLARRIGLAWERLPEPRHAFSLEIISPDRPSIFVNLGPHPPRLWPEDVDRLHELWLRLSDTEDVGAKLHHRDIVGVALRRLERDLTAGERDQVLKDLDDELRKPS
ncbi:MAG TPA: APC family permease [Bryobacteraceae bacterium]|nr:APC family permease [Bryobacteraceae bacterium]